MYLMLPIDHSKSDQPSMSVSIINQNAAFSDPYTMHLSIGVAELHPEYIESIEIYVPL